MTVAPAAVAAAWVVGAFRLARELFDDPGSPDAAAVPVTGVAAAALVALSPLAVLHTALPLAYAFTAASATLASAALLRGVRTGSRASLCLAGAGFGVALLTRPLDAVLVAFGCLLYVAAAAGGRAGWRQLPWAVLG
nr:hypothetical protein [Micromonospora sp. DSM 115978]